MVSWSLRSLPSSLSDRKSFFFFLVFILDKEILSEYNKFVVRQNIIEYGGIAQLGERLNGIQEVSGSIPLISTKKT